jgi:hypothetical protein
MKTPKSLLHNSYRPAIDECEEKLNKNLELSSSDHTKQQDQQQIVTPTVQVK